jgi:hypothetical protein
MSNNYRWVAFFAALVFAAAVGFMAYNAGVAHGIVQSGKIVAPAVTGPGPMPYPYPYPYYGWHPWGFGFFFVPFLFFFLFIFFVRALFWGGRWRHHGCGYRHGDEGATPQQ